MGSEAQSRLTIAAKGVGFEETANAFDTLAKAQQRLIDAQTELSEALKSGSIGEVGRLTEETQGLKTVIDQLSNAQESVNSTNRDYLKLLREINPSLASFVDSMLSAVRVAGQLSGKNIDLASTVDFAKNAVTRYAGTFKLLAAGGVVLAAINLVTKAWGENADEVKRAEDAVKRHNDALRETVETARKLAVSLEAVSDTRREGGFTSEQSEVARQTVDRVRKQFPQLDESSINRVVPMLFGADDQAVAEAAFLDMSGSLQFQPGASAESRRRHFEKVRGRKSGSISTFFAREGEQRAALLRSALSEVTGQSPNTGAFEQFIRTIPGDAYAGREEELAKLAIDLANLAPGGQGAAGGRGIAVSDDELRELQEKKFVADRGLHASELKDMHEAINKLSSAIERLASEPRAVNINNSRFVGADAASRKARIVNGESQRARIEAP